MDSSLRLDVAFALVPLVSENTEATPEVLDAVALVLFPRHVLRALRAASVESVLLVGEGMGVDAGAAGSELDA
jgi:hypothetical protein